MRRFFEALTRAWPHTAEPAPIPIPQVAVVAHHLRLFGLVPEPIPGGGPEGVCIVEGAAEAAEPARRAAAAGAAVAVLLPSERFCAVLGVARTAARSAQPSLFRGPLPGPAARLRSLCPTFRFAHPNGIAIVRDARNAAVWLWLAFGRGGILLVGSDLAADLVRYRQGDPAQAARRPEGNVWGFAGERPLYLFEDQLAGEAPHERHADWWAATLADTVANRLGRRPKPILPGAAPGAVVLTGDDDQAELQRYERQLRLLDGAPITYFLHPLTRHSRATLTTMLGRRSVDLGLHPDALATPGAYAELFAQQAEWFRQLTDRRALAVRNHGYLNDGYWGHLAAWRRAGIRISANLPGLDGRVLNGSLLPARVVDRGELSEHWSILTAIGDGILFIRGMDRTQSADCVLETAQRIRDSGIPGVLVLNLHPENVEAAEGMHRAVLELTNGGFHPWTIRQCLEWFAARDQETQCL
ncbi:MAG TPA: hypothetical protein VGF07_10980 [Stellaceae bacterium]|jgi:hypothetical protein